jgi:trimeric autotransporter adhesin
MKTSFITCLLFIITQVIQAQVAINSNGASPAPGSMLDVSSDSKGILIPRLSTLQRTAIPDPPGGLLLFDTDSQFFR